MTESEKRNKTLILTCTKEDVVSALSIIEQCKINGKLPVVLASGFSAWIELRRRGVEYKTPLNFFDKLNSAAIDVEALHLAKTWYEPFRASLQYHGICLPELVEYDFVFIFIDALKCIDIANCLIESEKPSEIWVPDTTHFFRPNTIRYESLRKAIVIICEAKEISVNFFSTSSKNKKNNNALIPRAKDFLIDIYYLTRKLKTHLECFPKNKQKIVLMLSTDRALTVKKDLEKNRNIDIITPRSASDFTLGKFYYKNENSKNLLNVVLALNLSYRGVRLTQMLSERFSSFFSNDLALVARYIDDAEKMITRVNPEILITMEDVSGMLRATVRVCKKNGIKTLVVQHGALTVEMNGFHVMPLEADKQAVWGESDKLWAVKRGKAPETQVVTGNPKFDLLVAMKDNCQLGDSPIYTKLKLNPKKGIVVIATEWYSGSSSSYAPEEIEQFIRKSLQALKRFPEKQVVVKLHPSFSNEYSEVVRSILKELDMPKVVVTEKYLWQLLISCDLLIIQSSTTGLEALLFDKPVITYSSGANSNFYTGAACIINVDETRDFVAAIEEALYNEQTKLRLTDAREDFVFRHAYLQDGFAGKRVSELIQQMITQRKN